MSAVVILHSRLRTTKPLGWRTTGDLNPWAVVRMINPLSCTARRMQYCITLLEMPLVGASIRGDSVTHLVRRKVRADASDSTSTEGEADGDGPLVAADTEDATRHAGSAHLA